MHEELKSWGHPGGGRNAIILKGDGEPAIVVVREALATEGIRPTGWLRQPAEPSVISLAY